MWRQLPWVYIVIAYEKILTYSDENYLIEM